MAAPDSITISYTKPKSSPKDLFAIISKGKISTLYQSVLQMAPNELSYQLSRQDNEGKTLLHYACYVDLELISLYLISLGSNLYAFDRNGQSCFHALAYKGNYKTLNTILNYELHKLRKTLYDNMNMMKLGFGMTNINLTNTAAWILTSSIDADIKIKAKKLEYSEELVRKLRDYFSKVVQLYRSALGQVDSKRRNPLHYAALSKFTWCFKAAESLLTPHKVDNFNEFLEHFDNLEKLRKSTKKIDPKKYIDILDEIKSIIGEEEYRTYYKEFKAALKTVINGAINTKDRNGHTPLHIAAFSGCYQIVKKLVDLKADKKCEDSRALTPLQLASTKLVMKYLSLPEDMAAAGDTKGFEHLINSGYDVNISKNEFLLGSMHQAIIEGGILPTVITNQGDSDLVEWNLYTPLHYASMLGKLEDALQLIKQGADVNALSQYELTPLHLAAKNNKANMIKPLIENGAIKDARDHKDTTPFMLAAKYGALNSLKALLENGANPYEVDDRKWTALHYASFHNKSKIVEELIRWDSDYNKLYLMKNSQGKTPIALTSKPKTKEAFDTLWMAAIKGDLDLARRLVRKGHDINGRTLFERVTPLMNAAKNSQVLMVKFLLDNGAKVEVVDRYRHTALDYAREVGHPQIIAMIEGKAERRESPKRLNIQNSSF
ncbi:unnamed protein product [Blepharisma stoltei]|uniref:Uncharacterized protein n=1 Tax=Blepharisma stoltei TaxID=1481888 RepID=A0AAU9JU78_9CILI|nr:unnamed protein product [Blepharisma stoltei]